MIGESSGGAAGAGTMTAREARQALEDGAVLVDVREPDEWSAGHADDAIHIPLAELTDHLAQLPADREIITVCRSGRRSATAASLLTRHGLHATNLGGGMTDWVAAGLPIVNSHSTLPTPAGDLDRPRQGSDDAPPTSGQ